MSYISDSSLRTFDEARTYCQSAGTTIATVYDDYDSDCALHLCDSLATNNFCWIGLRKEDESDTFGWVDGTISSYRKWCDTCPDDTDYPLCAFVVPDGVDAGK